MKLYFRFNNSTHVKNCLHFTKQFEIMVRKLKYHEKKLLKKVDFISWNIDNNLHEIKMMKRFHIQKREDYTMYNKLSRQVRDLARKIKELDEKGPFRLEATNQILEKLYNLGLIVTKSSLALADTVNASSFCRRRLPVLMVKSNMAENLKAATTFIEQGQIWQILSHGQTHQPLENMFWIITILGMILTYLDDEDLKKVKLQGIRLH